jgi:hypothetical protein
MSPPRQTAQSILALGVAAYPRRVHNPTLRGDTPEESSLQLSLETPIWARNDRIRACIGKSTVISLTVSGSLR